MKCFRLYISPSQNLEPSQNLNFPSRADRLITPGVWPKSLYCLCAQLLLGAYPSRLKSLRNKFDDDSLPISLFPESLEKIVFVEGNEGRFLDWGNGPKLPTSYIHIIKQLYLFSNNSKSHNTYYHKQIPW